MFGRLLVDESYVNLLELISHQRWGRGEARIAVFVPWNKPDIMANSSLLSNFSKHFSESSICSAQKVT